jgi:hypothetical protein
VEWLGAIDLRRRRPARPSAVRGYPVIDRREVVAIDDQSAGLQVNNLAVRVPIDSGLDLGRIIQLSSAGSDRKPPITIISGLQAVGRLVGRMALGSMPARGVSVPLAAQDSL